MALTISAQQLNNFLLFTLAKGIAALLHCQRTKEMFVVAEIDSVRQILG